MLTTAAWLFHCTCQLHVRVGYYCSSWYGGHLGAEKAMLLAAWKLHSGAIQKGVQPYDSRAEAVMLRLCELNNCPCPLISFGDGIEKSWDCTQDCLWSCAGAGDGMVKFWDLRKMDTPSWHLAAPSPGVAQQVLTPTPNSCTRSKVCSPMFGSACS